ATSSGSSSARRSRSAGAPTTTAALQEAGRVVRVARIPRPEGKDKVDLNELVAQGGPEALHKVLREASDWVEHQLDRIPADAPKHEVSARLRELLPLLRTADPVLRDGYAELIKRRFKLRAQTVRELLREPPAERGARKTTA